MFTPLKNLITYIQKNASGSTFFGGSSSNIELNENAMMESELVAGNTAQLTELASCVNSNDKSHDQNENEVLDVSTVTSVTSIDDPLLIKEGEGEKDIYLDFPPTASENEENDVEFPTNEVIVLDDPDLNTSINSDPGTDPLAIDEYNATSVANSPIQLDSSAESDALYTVNIDEIGGGKCIPRRNEVDRGVLSVGKDADEQEIRSDGSDSGLGSETSALQSTVTSVVDSSACSTASSSPIVEKIISLRSNLKRRLQSIDEGQQVQKKLKRAINFDGVKVFYFPRIQGHGCVPSQGGCTLGMAAHHISFKTFSLTEHAAELRRAHKLQLQEINPRGSSSEESDSEEELSEGSGSDLDAETIGFLQPVPPKQRRALLKAAGVRKIDPNEKIECRNIRNSREICGCTCRDFCDPDTCACSQAGIKCQVDRAMFPCGCSRDACGNVIGRIEFNPARVRTHFIHTIMRLEMENRQQKRPDGMAASSNHLGYSNSLNNSTPTINSYNSLPNYGIEQTTSGAAHPYHHHMHQQQNAYINHMSPTLTGGNVYANLSNPMVMDSPGSHAHNPYVSSIVTEQDSISSSLTMNGNSLHYTDGPIYPQVQAPSLAPPPPATPGYGDILAPYASSTPYHSGGASGHVVDANNYTTNVYTNYHSPHHLHNHVQQPQQQFLGYSPSCSGEMNDYSDSQSSFISLNTPEASSSRLSAINDLLHNSRNITTALVAVSPEEVTIASVSAIDQLENKTDSFAVEEGTTEIVNEVPLGVQEHDKIVEDGKPETPPDKELAGILTRSIPAVPDEDDSQPPEATEVNAGETSIDEPNKNEVIAISSESSSSNDEGNETGSPVSFIKKNDHPIVVDVSPSKSDDEPIADIPPVIVETVSA